MEKILNVLNESYNDFYNKKFNDNFILLEGNIKNIIISCPHAVEQLRKGKIKPADINTGPLGFALHSLGYTVIIRTKNFNDDPNFDKRSKYKNFLSKYIKDNNIKFLLDLHGMSPKRTINFSLGTSFGKFCNYLNMTTINEFCRIAHQFNIDKIGVDFPFSSVNKNTVSNFISRKNHIETLQLETNSKLFFDDESKINVINIVSKFLEKIQQFITFEKCNFNFNNFLKYDKSLYYNNKFNKTFTFINNNSNLLVTAPNSCENFVSGSVKTSQSRTGALTFMLCENKICDGLIKTKNTNFNSSPEYIETCCNLKKYKFIIELRILNSIRKQDISIVCDNGKSISQNSLQVISRFLNIFNRHKFFNVDIDYPFDAYNRTKPLSIINENTGIDCVQLFANLKILKNKQKSKKFFDALQDICFYCKIM